MTRLRALAALLPWLAGHWWLAAAAIAALYLGSLQLTIARQGATIGRLEERLGRSVQAVTAEELKAALDAREAGVRRTVVGLEETIKAIPRGRDTVLVREVARPGPPGPPGPTGAPGRAGPPGTPLVPPAEQPRARQEAPERIVAWFDPGTLVGCDTPGQPPSTVEFLRQPGGRLLSTAPCVWRIDDEVIVRRPAPGPVRRLFEVRPYLAMGWIAGGAEAGVGADLLHLGDLSLGADLRFARGEVRIGAGPAFSGSVGLQHAALAVSAPALGEHARVQAGYAWSLRRCGAGGGPPGCLPDSWFVGVSLRF